MDTRSILRYIRKHKLIEKRVYITEFEGQYVKFSFDDLFMERFYELLEPVMRSVKANVETGLADILWEAKELDTALENISLDNPIFLMFGVHRGGVHNANQIRTILEIHGNLNIYDDIFFYVANEQNKKRSIELIVVHL